MSHSVEITYGFETFYDLKLLMIKAEWINHFFIIYMCSLGGMEEM